MDEGKRTVIIDGKMVDLDKISTEELLKMKEELENKLRRVREEIDKLLKG